MAEDILFWSTPMGYVNGFPELQALWQRWHPNSQPTGDREDWLEAVLRLDTLLNVHPREHVWVRTTTEHQAVNAATGEVCTDAGRLARMKLVGPVANVGHLSQSYLSDPRLAGERVVDSYWAEPVFLAHAGRPVIRTTCGEGQGFPATKDTINALAPGRVCVKDIDPKMSFFTTTSPFDSHDFFSKVSMWSLDRPGALLVQPWVPLSAEYRIFVVGHKVVTGAGCIEHLTPVDALARPFDLRVERTRGASPVFEAPELVARYLQWAESYTAAWRQAHSTCGDYVVDVALKTDTDEVVAIEMNGLHNSGLYASDVRALFEEWCR